MNCEVIRERVLHVEADYRVYATLVKGEKLAVLWDTGLGKADLRAFLAQQVQTPYLVMNSHGHYDHIGGNGQFPQVLASRADWPLIASETARLGGQTDGYELLDLPAGQVFDLGGLHARTVSLAGHTRGSMGLLLEEERLLLAGDGLNPRLLVSGGEAAPLSVLRETLQTANGLPFDSYLASHYPKPLSRTMVGVHLRHLEVLPQGRWVKCSAYGRDVRRSAWREGREQSVILYDEPFLQS